MRMKLFRKIWDVVFVPRSQLIGKKKARAVLEEDVRFGDCDHPDKKNKKIRIADDLTPIEELDTIIHEALHACDWYKDEEWVELAASDIAKLLTKLGYCRSDRDKLTKE